MVSGGTSVGSLRIGIFFGFTTSSGPSTSTSPKYDTKKQIDRRVAKMNGETMEPYRTKDNQFSSFMAKKLEQLPIRVNTPVLAKMMGDITV